MRAVYAFCAFFAFCACPDNKVPLTGGPPRDHGADGAPCARRMPVPQHSEGPAGGTVQGPVKAAMSAAGP